jgi:hypothetical protein
MKAILTKVRGAHFRLPTRKGIMRQSYKAAHISYFGSVGLEAHGLYGTMGIVLFAMSVADIFLHFEQEA